MSEEGCLLISDITGYTTYLNESELEHARDSLGSLLELLIEHTRAPLVLIDLEGDAVFSYAPAGSIRQGQTVLEMIETTYAAFRRALELMILNTTCTCNACRNLPRLDLKFFVHYGTYSVETLGTYTRLLGTDVVLIHRLVKNTVAEATGLRAYAAYTGAAVDALGLADAVSQLPSHAESYEDVGDVRLFVHDMHGVWERKREEVRIEVRPEEAVLVREFDFPVPPPVLWDFITKPEFRKLMFDADSNDVVDKQGGRTSSGSAYYCAHGTTIYEHRILDWHPFEQYTTNDTWPVRDVTGPVTYRLEPRGDGTRLRVLFGRPEGSLVARTAVEQFFKFTVTRVMPKRVAKLRERILEELDAMPSGASPVREVDSESIQTAVGESLASTLAPSE
ncbi:MAG: DUF2652 domain-containing protein [Anaerolineae bacterium]